MSPPKNLRIIVLFVAAGIIVGGLNGHRAPAAQQETLDDESTQIDGVDAEANPARDGSDGGAGRRPDDGAGNRSTAPLRG